MKKIATLFLYMVSSFACAMNQPKAPVRTHLQKGQAAAERLKEKAAFGRAERARAARRKAELARLQAAMTAGIYTAGPIPLNFNS
ncbi:MAG: hypothetical protein ACD_64C00297G0001 [uncultured bacterium]|nr:MAG: hypothetical protein ACD_64C00297G0001 [uncultured bacterium]